MASRKTVAVLFFIVAMTVAFALGWYRDGMADAESVHFAINYPAEGTEVGGLGAQGKDGYLRLDLQNTGVLKRMAQVNVVNLSSHWVTNVDSQPHRIRLEVRGVDYPVRWESTDRTWNEEDHSIGRVLDPDEMVTVDWYITLPKPLPSGPTLLDGQIVVLDADTGESLSVLPIEVVNGGGEATAQGGDCCAP